MYYLCSKNECADQLQGYRAADLRLCFRIFSQKTGFVMTWLIRLLSFNQSSPHKLNYITLFQLDNDVKLSNEKLIDIGSRWFTKLDCKILKV